ncbi:MAG: XRE family transcriptional regulator [Candidatus Omnitrophica bacterium]|nr:XRE family transcriptional regulator [Candidatus Omnitrophota bacterium]
MITNERQYRITRVQLEKLKSILESSNIKEVVQRGSSNKLVKAEFDALQSELEDLSSQLREYEMLRSGAVEMLRAPTLEELPGILIRARIARGFSQRKLGELLGLKEQQIQRYEAEKYASASLSRFAKIAKALNLNISEIAEFKTSQESQDVEIANLPWDKFPVKEMYLRNWFKEFFSGSLKKAMENATDLAKQFVTSSFDRPDLVAMRQRIRVGGNANMYSLFAWQCRIMMLAKDKEKKITFDQEVMTDGWFTDLARLSCAEEGPLKAIEYLERYGIRLAVEPHLANTYLDGAALLLPSGPVVGMTLRYDRLDSFWFVLFHELVHIKKHLSKKGVNVIFDDLDVSADAIEEETDRCASEILVPNEKWEVALARYVRSKESIIEFAKELKINPAIVAGKIRKESENYTILTDLVGQGEVRKLFPAIDFSY